MASSSSSDYRAFLGDVKHRIEQARLAAGRAVNHALVSLYWEIGQEIVAKQSAKGWGEGVWSVWPQTCESNFQT